MWNYFHHLYKNKIYQSADRDYGATSRLGDLPSEL